MAEALNNLLVFLSRSFLTYQVGLRGIPYFTVLCGELLKYWV